MRIGRTDHRIIVQNKSLEILNNDDHFTLSLHLRCDYVMSASSRNRTFTDVVKTFTSSQSLSKELLLLFIFFTSACFASLALLRPCQLCQSSFFCRLVHFVQVRDCDALGEERDDSAHDGVNPIGVERNWTRAHACKSGPGNHSRGGNSETLPHLGHFSGDKKGSDALHDNAASLVLGLKGLRVVFNKGLAGRVRR